MATEPVVMQWFVSSRGTSLAAQLDPEQQVGAPPAAHTWVSVMLLLDTPSHLVWRRYSAHVGCCVCLLSHLAHLTPPLPATPQLYLLRKFVEADLRASGLGDDDAYVCSLSSTTVVYKGQLTPEQVGARQGRDVAACSESGAASGSFWARALTGTAG